MPVGAGGAVENPADRVIDRRVVHAARHQHQRLAEPGQPLGIPEPRVVAPRPDGDDRLDAVVHQRLVALRPRQMRRQQPVRRAPAVFRRRLRHTGPAKDHRPIAAHGIADHPHGIAINDRPKRPVQRRHAVDHKPLVDGPVQQRRPERALVGIGAVGVVDRHGDIALGRQVFAQMAHQEPVAGIAVADHDQRKQRVLGRGRIARRAPRQRRLPVAVAQGGDVFAPRLGARCCGIPHLDRQRAVIGGGIVRRGVQDVDLTRMGKLQRLHADHMVAIGRQCRRIGADLVNRVGTQHPRRADPRKAQCNRFQCGGHDSSPSLSGPESPGNHAPRGPDAPARGCRTVTVAQPPHRSTRDLTA